MEIKKVNIFYPIFIFGFIFLNLFVALFERSLILHGFTSGFPIWLLYVQNEVIILFMVLVYCLIFKVGLKDLRIKLISFKTVVFSLIIGYLIVPMALFITNIMTLFVENGASTTVSLVSPYSYGVQILLIAVMPAIVEEISFRGIFYGTYRKSQKFFHAMLLSAVLFGLFHLNFDQFVYATFMGFLFARLTEATGSIVSSMCAHFAFNTFSVTTNYLAIKSGILEEAENVSTTESASHMIYTYIVLFVLGVICVWLAIKMMDNLRNTKDIQAKADKNIENNINNNYNACVDSNAANVENVSADGNDILTNAVNLAAEPIEQKRLITLPLVVGMLFCIIYMVLTIFM